MIRVLYDKVLTTTGLHYQKIACLSTDEKPTEKLVTGSKCLEVDTGDEYAFDESSSTWYKQTASASTAEVEVPADNAESEVQEG